MAQQANITVFDGATVPVSHTLVALGVKSDSVLGDQAYWRENLGSLPEMAQVQVAAFRKKLKSGFTRSEMRVIVPVMESVSGVNAFGYTASPKLAHGLQAAITLYASPRATYNEKVLLMQILRNLANNVSVTTPAVTAGPFNEMFHSNIFLS